MGQGENVAQGAPLGSLAWLLLAALTIHVAEEWPDFPVWATERFGTTSPRFYVLSHVPIFAVMGWVAWAASRPAPRKRDLWLHAALCVALGANGIFHIIASVAFSEASPGLWSGALVFLPLCAVVLPRLRGPLEGSFSRATLCGAAVSMAFAASLWLDMPQ